MQRENNTLPVVAQFCVAHEKLSESGKRLHASILDLSKELVLEEGYSQKALYKDITTYLKSFVTETEHILYSACYGGFGFSKDFRKFAKLDKYDEPRKGMYDIIAKFGKHIAETFPLVYKMIQVYEMCDFSQDFTVARTHINNEKNLRALEANLKLMQRYKEEHAGIGHTIYCMEKYKKLPYDNSPLWMLRSSNTSCDELFDLSVTEPGPEKIYSMDEIIEQVRENIKSIKKSIMASHDKLVPSIVHTLDFKWQEELKNDKKPWYERSKSDDDTFVEALSKYGETYFGIWKYQKILKNDYMRHILLHKLYEKIQYDGDTIIYEQCHASKDEIEAKAYVTLGLLCASGKYASLAFQEVPKGLSYKISEYDGRESIIVS